MPYGYIGQNLPNQTKANSGVFSISDVADLEKQGKFGGSLELIEEQTASSDSAIDFLSIQENKYDVHLLQVNNYQADTDNSILTVKLYESGVLETASVYQYAIQGGRANGTFSEYKSTASGLGVAIIGSGIDNASSSSANGYIYFYNLGNSSKYSFATEQFTYIYYTDVYEMNFGGGVLPQASTVNGFRIVANAGTFSGNFKLYGVKQL
jgi:hypothetical protein|tara:strand:+ start:779 stop:1405 length:627 start_codon:yes stop_codon:yes gene_type:complete